MGFSCCKFVVVVVVASNNSIRKEKAKNTILTMNDDEPWTPTTLEIESLSLEVDRSLTHSLKQSPFCLNVFLFLLSWMCAWLALFRPHQKAADLWASRTTWAILVLWVVVVVVVVGEIQHIKYNFSLKPHSTLKFIHIFRCCCFCYCCLRRW